ncbi:glycosyltransferase [Clostridium perfringens]|uniref:glycosyltransferase n=1 Tax=Clostridium perfringens TaxID=1502 RepID=UPI0022461028|nr:glycosyltransferase [Clostridium perfringens]MCX0394645.1 glycosyltransferase [Clostridium perfringens]MDK0912636.1 glycosyltransferase [Clostridium perfringens]MDK0950212.1 glycosyltransferase [Clostridium perfringens]MDM0988965.1 glycosyltransferase [Clostridium perfringens]
MKKKILFVIDNLNSGGAEKTLVTLLNNFDFKKYELTLFLFSKEGVYLEELSSNIKLKYLFNLKASKIKIIINKIRRKIFFLFNSKSLFRTIMKNKINSIIGEDYDTYIAFMEGLSTKIVDLIGDSTKKKIAWIHTDVSKYDWYKKYYKSYDEEKRCYLNFEKIVCVSKDSLKGFEKKYFKDKNKLVVIYNVLDKNQILKKANKKFTLEGDFKISNIGRLEEEKGQDILIKAFAKSDLNKKNNYLYIIGEGSREKYLKSLCEKLNINKKVRFIGFNDNPYKYIKNSDVVVSSSRNEGFSLVVAEAIIIGKMVISTNCSGPIEILENGKFGVIVKNENELVDILNEININRRLISKYEVLAKDRSSIFDLNNTLEKIYNIL